MLLTSVLVLVQTGSAGQEAGTTATRLFLPYSKIFGTDSNPGTIYPRGGTGLSSGLTQPTTFGGS